MCPPLPLPPRWASSVSSSRRATLFVACMLPDIHGCRAAEHAIVACHVSLAMHVAMLWAVSCALPLLRGYVVKAEGCPSHVLQVAWYIGNASILIKTLPSEIAGLPGDVSIAASPR